MKIINGVNAMINLRDVGTGPAVQFWPDHFFQQISLLQKPSDKQKCILLTC